ncbi:hypothetical protein [Methylobacterium frigidaeris]|uniref:Uncharacterized protein n=1 Tax=Methylobacterium frigidaeris TaxID=2038277 RepID=A0AA37HEY9_9HYPH|nr:hypothetical protein [Methylobacterium frigidaeris]PIK74685.1 hypothetical protein CS379_01235 [Methylobacterium frigidaeris]GJD64797.1 hypothetical protein MPEAHAMD_4982 [Methylobacterium frigidaeris]
MSQPDTPVPDPDATSRALVPLGAPEPARHGPRVLPARPLATFLVHLIDGPTGSLRPSRRDRSRVASAQYAAGSDL